MMVLTMGEVPSPWTTWINDTFIHGCDLLIYGLKCHPSDFSHFLQRFGAILEKMVNYMTEM